MNKLVLISMVIMTHLTIIARGKVQPYLEARRNGADAKLKIYIVDNDDNAVSNASVRVFMGMNFRPKGHWIEGKTNGNGVFDVKGKTCGDEIEIHASKLGFYDSTRRICFAEIGAEHEVRNGKWLPYGVSEKLRLRPIQNPVALHKVGFGMGKDVPATNIWLGVDMALGDFVKPHGKGVVADFEIIVEWDGRQPADSNYCGATIRFSHPLSGGYYFAKVQESAYPYVYRANKDEEYQVKVVKIVGRERIGGDLGRRFSSTSFGDDAVLVTRSRCVLDELGNMKFACYGFIRILSVDAGWEGKPTMRFACVFNPTPNDTNLEAK